LVALGGGEASARDRGVVGLPGVPAPLAGRRRSATQIGRDPSDRKKMAVLRAGGRHAVTHIRPEEVFGPPQKAVFSLCECRLETGRTHQIRVHMAYLGHPLVGDPVYGGARKVPGTGIGDDALAALEALRGQALHAETLGFIHPRSGAHLKFSARVPQDFAALLNGLRGADGAGDLGTS